MATTFSITLARRAATALGVVRTMPVLRTTPPPGPALPSVDSPAPKPVALLSGNDSFIFHWANVEVTFPNEARIEWAQVARPGHKPVVAMAGENLRTMSMSVTVGYEHEPDRDIEVLLSNLRYMVAVPGAITIAYGQYESGTWRCTNMEVKTLRRRPGDQRTTVAQVDLEFLEDSPAPYPRPVPAAPPPPPPPPPPAPARAAAAVRTYTVRKGDTLWQLAVNYYKNGLRWTEIANRNGIKDPRKLQIGTVLVIP